MYILTSVLPVLLKDASVDPLSTSKHVLCVPFPLGGGVSLCSAFPLVLLVTSGKNQ